MKLKKLFGVVAAMTLATTGCASLRQVSDRLGFSTNAPVTLDNRGPDPADFPTPRPEAQLMTPEQLMETLGLSRDVSCETKNTKIQCEGATPAFDTTFRLSVDNTPAARADLQDAARAARSKLTECFEKGQCSKDRNLRYELSDGVIYGLSLTRGYDPITQTEGLMQKIDAAFKVIPKTITSGGNEISGPPELRRMSCLGDLCTQWKVEEQSVATVLRLPLSNP